MSDVLTRNWWTLVVRGAVAAVFGIAALAISNIALTTLALLFAAFVVIDGAFKVYDGFTMRGTFHRWWAILAEGVVGITAGIAAVVWPAITSMILLYIIAVWAIITGALRVFGSYYLRQEIEREWFLGLGGVLSVVFGLYLLVWPGTGALSLVWLIGLFAVLYALTLVALGFRMRQLYITHSTDDNLAHTA
jgi:uncharacterized membrane protein HdeD (DUF308 family)